MSMGITTAPGVCNKGFWNFADAATGPIHSISSFFLTVVACRCATFAYGGIMGIPMGVIRAPACLQTLELRIHRADSLQI